MDSTIDIQNREELKQQFFLRYPYVSKDYAEEMVNFILSNIKLSLAEQKVEQVSVPNNVSENSVKTVTNEDVKKFVYEITGVLKDKIHRNNIVLFGNGKNDSNNLQTTARYRETHRFGLNYKNKVSSLIPIGSYEDAILLGNFFVSTIFDYDNNFHEFQGSKRRAIIGPSVPETQLLYGNALYSAEEYEKILRLKLRNILNLELDEAQIFFSNELTRILSEKRINI